MIAVSDNQKVTSDIPTPDNFRITIIHGPKKTNNNVKIENKK